MTNLYLANIYKNVPLQNCRRHFIYIWWYENICILLYSSCFNKYSFFFFFFLGPHLWHMEVPSLGIKLKLQLSAYTTVTGAVTYTATWGKGESLIPWARPGIKSSSSWILVRFLTCWATMGTSSTNILLTLIFPLKNRKYY